MRLIGTALACAAALLAVTPASAATFVYRFVTDEPFVGGTVAFTFQSDGPAPIGSFIQASALTDTSPGLARIRFTDACFIVLPGANGSTACDIVEAIVDTSFGSTQVVRFFADGALTTPGSYASLRGTAASFDVSIAAAAVPEPASWAMMILGVGAVGGALRRRRPLPATA